MFNPAGFFGVALELCERSRSLRPELTDRDAAVRTAFGRAYYGLYLIVRSAIIQRHGLSDRRIAHGALYTHLQSSRAPEDLRSLGRHLQYLYSLRRRADYELAPGGVWEAKLRNPAAASALTIEAERLAHTVPHVDFTPILHLLDPLYDSGGGHPEGDLQ